MSKPQSWFPAVTVESRAESRGLAAAKVYSSVALLVVLFLGLHSFHFRDRNYRGDEVITAHASTFRSPSDVVQWMAFDIHPPLWRVGGTSWAGTFGQNEHITRFFSTLLSAITLALVYRLAADLFGRRAGLLAVFALGTLGHYQFYSHEFRPYPALMMFTAAAQLALLRWIRSPNLKHAAFYVFAALGVLYTHYFGTFVIAAQIPLFVLLVRWNLSLYLRAFGLLVAVGVGYLPWLFVLLHTVLIQRPDGVTYARGDTWQALLNTHEKMQIRPLGLGMFILVIALVTPIVARKVRAMAWRPFRFGPSWRKWYIATFVGLVLIAVFIANDERAVLTRRNLSILVPSIAVLAGFGLYVMPARLRVPALAIVLVPALFDPMSLEPNAPYREVLAAIQPDYQPGDRLLMSEPGDYQRDAFRDYLTDRLPMTHVSQEARNLPRSTHASPENPPLPDNPQAARAELAEFVGEARRVFYVEAGEPSILGLYYLRVLHEDYALTQHLKLDNDDYHANYEVYEFTRIPEPRSNIHFGDQLTLAGWLLQGDVMVQPCEEVRVQTFWTAGRVPDDNYSMSLVLADSSGVGIARTDREPAGILPLQWEPNRVYLDERSVQVPCDAIPSEFPVLVAVYDYETLDALPASYEDGTEIGGIVYLTTVYVD